jgi:hypothetical protein
MSSKNSSFNKVNKNVCKNCGNKYTNKKNAKSKHCLICTSNNNFIEWSNENGMIDNFIQEMQLKINKTDDDIVELVPYYKFGNIKDISKGNSCTIYLVTYINGNYIVRYLSRHSRMKFGLKKCLNYVTRDNEFLIFLIEVLL